MVTPPPDQLIFQTGSEPLACTDIRSVRICSAAKCAINQHPRHVETDPIGEYRCAGKSRVQLNQQRLTAFCFKKVEIERPFPVQRFDNCGYAFTDFGPIGGGHVRHGPTDQMTVFGAEGLGCNEAPLLTDRSHAHQGPGAIGLKDQPITFVLPRFDKLGDLRSGVCDENTG